jgi:diguanylate cyclase (GGDEF)-like protein
MGGNASDPQSNEAASRAPAELETSKLLAHTQKLAQLNAWFEVALNNMARGLSMFDADKRLIVCNAIYREIYELPEELTRPGTHISDLVSFHAKKEGGSDGVDERAHQHRWIERHVRELARGKSFTHTQYLKNGRIILVTNQPLADGGWVDIQEDVTEKTHAQERIAWLARHDPLTETANRFHLRELLDEEMKRMPAGGSLAIHWIDLDRFKHVNDTFGHAAGDALLKAVAKRMRATVRDHDFVGRLGGDEFAVIQTNLTGADQAETLAKRLLTVLNASYRVLGQSVKVGASIGVVMAPEHGTDADVLLKKADLALYRVKSSGRGNFEFYQPCHELAPGGQVEIEDDIRTALASGQLEMHYQPIVNVKTNAVASFEALMRWRHPELGMVSPAVFIPLAEKNGAIVGMGNWAIQQACRDAATWPGGLKVTVNLSAVQFERSDPFQIIADALAASGLAPNRLEVEITETVLLRDEERTRASLMKLRGLGIGIALDDFGTAFASLSYLRNFSFDKIKIDRSFVRDMSERKDCLAIVNAVAGLAKSLEMSTVAEGIETSEQLAHVTQAGCNEVQGFYFSRAVPAGEVAAVVAQCERLLASTSDGA